MKKKNSEKREFEEDENPFTNRTGFGFILYNMPDEEIIEVLSLNPDFLKNLCLMSTLEEQILKEEKTSINKN